VYVLIIVVRRDVTVDVGALGEICFEKGLYAYVGSAQKGLKKRIERHLRKIKQRFWHIDYLLGNDAVKVQTVFCREAGRAEECRIAQALGERGVPVKGVGSSDCQCVSHLFKVEEYQFLSEPMHEVRL
jgi:sugar fermentation stimulation protein A